MHAETRYARSGDLCIAYQVLGEGPIDLVFAPGHMSHLEQNQWWPPYASFLEREPRRPLDEPAATAPADARVEAPDELVVEMHVNAHARSIAHF